MKDEPILFYEREYYVFSNFSAFRLHWFGLDFDTSEHAYQWMKFPNCEAVRQNILAARSAHEAFKYAEQMVAFRQDDWPAKRVDVMREIIKAKFAQHEYVRRKLAQSRGRILIEDSWRDSFWGWGPHRVGENMLGKLWMELRDEINEARKQ